MGTQSRSTSTAVLWTTAGALVLGAATYGVLALVERDDAAQEIVVEATEGAGDEDLGEVGAPADDEQPETPPAAPSSVLAEGVSFYSVADYSFIARDGDVRASEQDEGGLVLATNDEYQALLEEEILDPTQVYDVEVEHLSATEEADAAWGVHIRFNDAALLASETADLGCSYRPDNVVAIASGTELITLLQVSDEYCDSGFPRGEILWSREYDESTAEDIEAEARSVAAQMLGDD